MAALEQLDLSQDYLPEEIRLEYELAEYNFAAVQIHFPSGQEQYLEARKRLEYDNKEEFLYIKERLYRSHNKSVPMILVRKGLKTKPRLS